MESWVNTLDKFFMNPIVWAHIGDKPKRIAVFSWRETFDMTTEKSAVETSMLDMILMSDAVYSPDNESSFDFGFVLKEIRYPDPLIIT